ncbi:TIGR03862 family flavoprotein [Ideonella sp. 4Y11]|uniref:TIGR03862 family flavoprotein n=1 Tax=Ideonella aquatica TaxID=2824119 RepID=A0A941BEF1_9BURK|nr:TIGR03862 family flavoprotein [Ideonella aquatica]MBQ0957656.1 TIGR03862 family flavoprotein [Ideonella aquatica]
MSDTTPATAPRVAVVGAGPAGLMAAEVLAAAGAQVDVFDASAVPARKFLLAGKGGLNLTHSEPLPAFTDRYAERAPEVARWLQTFGPQALRDWAQGLGVSTFVGSSGRVFPESMKAAPLLRAWLHRLRASGVRLHLRHRWQAGALQHGPELRFETPDGPRQVHADALLLALGGASWARLGSDGAWVQPLGEAGLALSPLQPANCGFDVGWSEHFASRHAGAPLKSVLLDARDSRGRQFRRKGECVVTATGLEGSLVYAASALLRDEIAAHGRALVLLDLLPDRPLDELQTALARGRGARSLANHLKEQAGLSGAKAGLLREGLSAEAWQLQSRDVAWLARRIKALPLQLHAARPIDEAISTAGGVRLEALDAQLMWRDRPGVFFAGEMLDWEAPTGGYLLTACFASGVVAARGLLQWWAAKTP